MVPAGAVKGSVGPVSARTLAMAFGPARRTATKGWFWSEPVVRQKARSFLMRSSA